MNTAIDTVSERAKLEADIATTLVKLEQMRKDLEAARRYHKETNLYYEIGHVEASVVSMRDRLVFLDKLETYQRRVATADDDARAAFNSMEGIKDQLLVVEGRIANIKKRADEMIERDRSAIDEATNIEADAIRAYSSAVGACDAKAEKAAHIKVMEAQAAVTATQAQAAKNDVIISAFSVESLSLGEQADRLRQSIADDRRRMLLAIEAGLEAKWDVAATDLAALAAKIVAVGQHLGGGCFEMQKLNMPVFVPGSSGRIDFQDVREASHAIAESQLLPA